MSNMLCPDKWYHIKVPDEQINLFFDVVKAQHPGVIVGWASNYKIPKDKIKYLKYVIHESRIDIHYTTSHKIVDFVDDVQEFTAHTEPNIGGKMEDKNTRLYDLINKYAQKQEDIITNEQEKECMAFLEKQPIYQELFAIEKKYSDRFLDLDIKARFRPHQLLTKEQFDEYSKIMQKHNDKITELYDTINEIKALISAADTYEQKYKILTSYGVIK